MKLGMVLHQNPHWSFCQEQIQSRGACWKQQGQGTEPCDVEVQHSSFPDMAVDNDVLLLEIINTLPWCCPSGTESHCRMSWSSGERCCGPEEVAVPRYSQAVDPEGHCPLKAAVGGCGLGCRCGRDPTVSPSVSPCAGRAGPRRRLMEPEFH